MIAHLQGKLVEKTPTHVIIDCGGIGYHEHLLTYLFFASKWRFYQIVHSPSKKEDAHTLFDLLKSQKEILNCYFQFQVLS
jgi:Holliday junction DNA helicase RuvA